MLQMSRVVALGLALLTVPMITFAQQELTGDIVNRWIDSMDAVDEWGQNQEGIADALGEPEDPTDFQAIMQEAARQFPEIGAIIESHGFDGSEQWAAIGARILNAYGAVVMGAQAEVYLQQMNQQLEEIENNDALSQAQKSEMRAQIDQAKSMITGIFQASEEDQAAVRANRSRLETVFGN